MRNGRRQDDNSGFPSEPVSGRLQHPLPQQIEHRAVIHCRLINLSLFTWPSVSPSDQASQAGVGGVVLCPRPLWGRWSIAAAPAALPRTSRKSATTCRAVGTGAWRTCWYAASGLGMKRITLEVPCA